MTTMRIAGLAGRASTASFLLTAALASCGGHGTKVTQAVRTCADRWNQANMVGWGPAPVNVAFRRPVARERRSIQLSRGRRCIVAIDLGDGSWTCVLAGSGAYWCPPLKESTGPELQRNARIDKYGLLVLDQPPKGTHATPPLRWHRYPLVDGYIQPWTTGGSLRPGLTFKRKGRGRCQLEDSTVNSAVSCLTPDFSRYDACFPRHRDGRGGDIAACADGPGYTTFTRWKVFARIPDPPQLVPWRRIGDVSLGEPKTRVLRLLRDYGNESKQDDSTLSYRLPGGKVQIGFDRGRVSTIWFSTPYYRTDGGFGVGSRIPRGHTWHGFVWNAWVREKPCSCWVKVGLGKRSLPATTKNFLKPWFFIDIRHGRVASFYFASRFVD
jgi:hypothetical protein